MITEEAIEKGRICDSGPAMILLKKLEALYKEPLIYQLDENGRTRLLKGENCERQEIIIKKLLEYYFQNPDQIPTRYYGDLGRNENFSDNSYPQDDFTTAVTFRKSDWTEDSLVQAVISYVISLTNKDTYNLYHKLVNLRIQKGKGFGIEPVTQEEINDRLIKKQEEEYTNMMMQEMLNELREGGNIIRSTAELNSIVRSKLEDTRTHNESILSPKAKTAKEKRLEEIALDAEEDAKLYKAMIKADAERDVKSNADAQGDGIEL